GHSASHSTRVPAGHPEGYLESFAQLYSDLSEQIIAKKEGRQPEPESFLAPGVSDGVDGVRFIMAVLESSRHNSAWTRIPASLRRWRLPAQVNKEASGRILDDVLTAYALPREFGRIAPFIPLNTIG